MIVQNTGAWVFLGDAHAPNNENYKTMLGLTEFQVSLISEMKKGTFMLKVDNDIRVIDTTLSDEELWAFGQTGKPTKKLIDRIVATNPSRDEFAIKLMEAGGFYDVAKQVSEVTGSCNRIVWLAAE